MLTRGITLREIPPSGSNSRDARAWTEEFRRALAREDLALATVRAYYGDLETFFRWYGPHRIDALTAGDLISYRQYLSEARSLKPASVQRKLEALRRFCRWAHQHGKLQSNVAAEVKLARPVRRVRPAGLTKAEAHSFAASRRTVTARAG